MKIFSMALMFKTLDIDTLQNELEFLAKMGKDAWYYKCDGCVVNNGKIDNYKIDDAWCINIEGGEQ